MFTGKAPVKTTGNNTGNTTGNTTGIDKHAQVGTCACSHPVLAGHRRTVCGPVVWHAKCYKERHFIYLKNGIKKIGSTTKKVGSIIKTLLSWMFFFIKILFWVLICVVIPYMLYMYGLLNMLFKIIQSILGDTTSKLYTEDELNVIKDQARLEGLTQCNCSGISVADISQAAMITGFGVVAVHAWPLIPAPAMNSLFGVFNTMSLYVTNDVLPSLVEYVGRIEVATRDEIWQQTQELLSQLHVG